MIPGTNVPRIRKKRNVIYGGKGKCPLSRQIITMDTLDSIMARRVRKRQEAEQGQGKSGREEAILTLSSNFKPPYNREVIS